MVQNGILGRQPIIQKDGKIYGYELLYRCEKTKTANFSDENHATSNVLINTLNNFGLEKIAGKKGKAFINVGKKMFMDPIIEAIPPDRFVIEILESVEVDDELIGRAKELHSAGYTLAIDDLNLDDALIRNFEPLFDYAKILKFDLMQLDMDALQGQLKRFKYYDFELLAEKVETKQEFDACKDLGFKYFQGYFFAKPDLVEGSKLDPAKAVVINVVNMLNTDADIHSIEKEFLRSPELSMNLLKYLNSASIFTSEKVSSISHAVNLIGRLKLAKWLAFYLYINEEGDVFNEAQKQSALFRAKFMSELAAVLKGNEMYQEKAYLVGMVSMMDALLNTSFEEIFQEISLESDIKEALLKGDNKLGKMLFLTKLAESIDPRVLPYFKKIGVNEERLDRILKKCYEWMYRTDGEML